MVGGSSSATEPQRWHTRRSRHTGSPGSSAWYLDGLRSGCRDSTWSSGTSGQDRATGRLGAPAARTSGKLKAAGQGLEIVQRQVGATLVDERVTVIVLEVFVGPGYIPGPVVLPRTILEDLAADDQV
jgi:hypothetical protein